LKEQLFVVVVDRRRSMDEKVQWNVLRQSQLTFQQTAALTLTVIVFENSLDWW